MVYKKIEKMLKSIFLTTAGIIIRVVLIYTWLIAFGICSEELDTIPALVCGLLLIIVFYFVHVRAKLPKKWTYDRLKFTKPKYSYLLFILVLFKVIGDFFWIFHIKTSQSTFTDDPIDVLVLAVIAFPLVEEFGFRLWLQTYLETKINKIIAVLSISIFFSFIHANDIPVSQLLSSIFYGIILIKTKSVWWPIFMHVLHNALIVSLDNISYIKTLAFILMDRQDNLNLIIAILFWILSGFGLLMWIKFNNEKIKL